MKKFFTDHALVPGGWCRTGPAGCCHQFQKQQRAAGAWKWKSMMEAKRMFLNKKDLVAMLENNGLKDLHNKKIASFDLLKMETILRRNSWIRDVQIYFDNNQILKIRIQERQPVARLFTVSGNSFLIDSSGIQMSLSERNVFRLPVFTGYPSEKFGLGKDSAMNRQIRDLAIFLNQDPFWSCQIQEVQYQCRENFSDDATDRKPA